ncbi:hypothetical protein, partial [Streptomyces sp. NPDC085665]|uniref:hypothetical protein n=1 Tax=Streptomyces sp. NPDC085665 TaxID=3365735 RepID=UPI0037D3212C
EMSQSTPNPEALTHFKNPARVSPTSRDNTPRSYSSRRSGAGRARQLDQRLDLGRRSVGILAPVQSSWAKD